MKRRATAAPSQAPRRYSAALEGSLAVAGTVTDGGGAPVPGIALTLTGPSGRRSVGTDNMGRFDFADLLPGNYRVRLDVPGRKRIRREPVGLDGDGRESDPAEIHITVALKWSRGRGGASRTRIRRRGASIARRSRRDTTAPHQSFSSARRARTAAAVMCRSVNPAATPAVAAADMRSNSSPGIS